MRRPRWGGLRVRRARLLLRQAEAGTAAGERSGRGWGRQLLAGCCNVVPLRPPGGWGCPIDSRCRRVKDGRSSQANPARPGYVGLEARSRACPLSWCPVVASQPPSLLGAPACIPSFACMHACTRCIGRRASTDLSVLSSFLPVACVRALHVTQSFTAVSAPYQPPYQPTSQPAKHLRLLYMLESAEIAACMGCWPVRDTSPLCRRHKISRVVATCSLTLCVCQW